MKHQKKDEKKVVAANYIITFYNEILQTNHSYSQYVNLLLELDNKYPNMEEGLETTDKETLKTAIQNLRYHIIQTYTMYKSISLTTKLEANPKIEEHYNILLSKFIIDRKITQEYVIEINNLFLDQVIKELLDTSTELISNIYEGEE